MCTPHVHIGESGAPWVIRTVCTVDDKLYRAFIGPGRHRRERTGAPLIGFPDGRPLEDSGAEERIRGAVAEIESLLARADPVAGVGDARGARRSLEELPMSVLLGVLDVLDERGLLGTVLPSLEPSALPGDRTRLGKALYLRLVAGLGDRQTTGDVIRAAAAVLDTLSSADRAGAYDYIMRKRRVPGDLERLVDGFRALEGARVKWREPVVVAGPSSGSDLPEPVGPGPWDKPADEPAELYIGKQAHDAIAKYYAATHFGERVYTNNSPISTLLDELKELGRSVRPARLSETEKSLRPDILNLSKLYIYEIKPTSQEGLADARAALYIGVLRTAGVIVSLGPAGAPGTSGQVPAPGGVFLFSSDRPGVIIYQYRRARLVPVPVPEDQKVESKGKSWTWELEPLSRERKRLLVVTILVTTAALVMALITAPVSA